MYFRHLPGCLLALSKWKTALVSLLFVLGLSLSGVAYGQHSVSGTVIDAETESPLPGVNIRVVGTETGTVTGQDGGYELSVPSPNDSLRFSFIGYEARTVAVNGRSTINITMEPATLTGTEVVVTGYQTQRRANITGAVDVADVENMQSEGSELVTEQLQGQVSGIQIRTSGQPGDQPQINIRGFNTFGNNDPLFVVDGMQTQDISFLNPRDIKNLQVLKDAGSASQYGARASNGVVVIETRDGRETDGVRVNYDASFGLQTPGQGENPFNILGPREQGELEFLARRNSGLSTEHPIWGSGEEPDVPEFILPARGQDVNPEDYFVIPQFKDPDLLGEFNQIVRANQEGTDWWDALTETKGQMSHQLSVSGGGEQGSYFTSFSYTNQQGIVINTELERYTVRANTEYNVNDNIRLGENLSFTYQENLQAGTLEGRNALGFWFKMHSIIPVRDIRGNFAGTAAPGLGTAQNPVALRERTRNDEQESRRLFGNVFMEADFLDDFTARMELGADLSTSFLETFQFPTFEQAQNVTTNEFSKNVTTDRNWTWTPTLNYSSTFGSNHNVSALIGGEAVWQRRKFDGISRQDFLSFDEDFTQLGTGSGTPFIDDSFVETSTLLSTFLNVNYDYDSTYLLSLTIRRDGSSKFLNNQWGTFPAVTAGIRLSEMSLFPEISWLTNLKIRGGWGIVGNQLNVNPNNSFTLFSSSQATSFYPIGGGSDLVEGVEQSQIGNPDAEWERNKDVNVGLDFAILDGQFEGSITYFNKTVEDLLFNPPLPATSGAASPPFRNVAEMTNKGLDASFRGEVDVTDELTIDATINLSHYKNEIENISPRVSQFSLGPGFSLPITRNEEGEPISSFFGFKIDGFWQSEEEIQQANEQAPDGQFMPDAAPGRFRYVDTNGDGQITEEDRVHLGNPHPDLTGGLNLSTSYRNWDLTLFLYGETGKEIWNQTRQATDFRSTFDTPTREATLEDSWTPNNRDAELPIQSLNQFFSTNAVPNSHFVESGDFLRLQNLKIGYTIPSSFTNRYGIENFRVWFQTTNLFTITPYDGLDPDIGATESAVSAGSRVGTGTTSFGIDRGGFPNPKTFSLGLNLTL